MPLCNKYGFIPRLFQLDVPKLVCSDYGFECDFVAEGDEIENVLKAFGQHTEEEHGIEYQNEVLQQFILRKFGA